MTVAYLNVECTASDGNVGCFLTATKGRSDRVATSPIFSDLVEMFAWMRANGWQLAEHHDGQFDPWRVAKTT